MNYSPRPQYSNGQINRAGAILRTKSPNSKEYAEALEVVNQWRTCHAYPLSTFKSTLRKKATRFEDSLVAQRLKRLPTIIDKLSRFETIKLTQMQDIGGIRAVLNSLEEVEILHNEYKDSRRFTHILVTEKNYIECPKSDGYRGIHLVFRYHNTLSRNGKAQDYDGLQIELQIRTHLQHTWATAVETVGTLKGESFKTGKGNEKWKDFLAYVSSAFAIAEGQEVLDAHKSMLPIDIYKKIAKIEKELNFRENLFALSKAANILENHDMGSYYNLIILDTNKKQIHIKGYAKTALVEATEDYAIEEKKAIEGIDTVLVSAGDLKSLKAAYPNYFLDIKEFLQKITLIIGSIK